MERLHIKDIIKKRNYLLIKLNKENQKLQNQNPLNIKEKNNIKKTIEKINKKLDKLEDILYECAEFKTKDFAEFMFHFLLLTEGDFKLTELPLANIRAENSPLKILQFKKAKKNKQRFHNIEEDMYYFISDESTKEFILKNLFEESDIKYNLYFEETKDLTILSDEYTYPFEEDLTMNKKFARYPRLKTAIYELIQLKLDNPTLNDYERFRIVLENTIKRNYKKNNYYQKKKRSQN